MFRQQRGTTNSQGYAGCRVDHQRIVVVRFVIIRFNFVRFIRRLFLSGERI
jgi:hypothetical protein